jgi:hypothetical protein
MSKCYICDFHPLHRWYLSPDGSLTACHKDDCHAKWKHRNPHIEHLWHLTDRTPPPSQYQVRIYGIALPEAIRSALGNISPEDLNAIANKIQANSSGSAAHVVAPVLAEAMRNQIHIISSVSEPRPESQAILEQIHKK